MSLHDLVPPKSIGAIYGRFSTKKQERTMQISTIDECLTKYDWTAPEVYFDEGVSATKTSMDERRDLQRLLDDAKAMKFSFVITYNKDRLARNAGEHQRIREHMARHGIPIVLASTESVYDTGDLISQLVSDGYTQYEAEQTRVRTRDTLEAKVSKGEWFGGPIPFGYQWDENVEKYVPVEADQILVLDIFQCYLKGMNFDDIANALPKGSMQGRDWNKDRVRSIVTNPFYAGYVRAFKSDPKSPNSIRPRSEWTMAGSNKIFPMISLLEWEECWRLFDQKRLGKIPPRTFKTTYLLRGLLYCEHERPGEPSELILMRTKNYGNKSSTGKKYSGRKYICACGNRVAAEDIEKKVKDEVDAIIRRKSDDDIEEEVQRHLDTEIDHLKKSIKELEWAVEEQKILMDRAGNEMKQFATWTDKEESEKLRYVMQQYRLDTQAHIDSMQQQIEQKRERMKYIQEVEIRSDKWQRLSHEAGDEKARRRLYLYLFERIVVSVNGGIDIVARVDA